MQKSDNEDVWDDTALIQAYDRAVNLAKEEVAKRIAMDTHDQQTKQKSQSSKYLNHTKKPVKVYYIYILSKINITFYCYIIEMDCWCSMSCCILCGWRSI